MTGLDQSLAAAVTGLEIAAVHAAGAIDYIAAYSPATKLWGVAIHRGDDTVAVVEAKRLPDALILAEQAVHNATAEAVAA